MQTTEARGFLGAHGSASLLIEEVEICSLLNLVALRLFGIRDQVIFWGTSLSRPWPSGLRLLCPARRLLPRMCTITALPGS